MSRGARITLAAAILLGGAAGAMLFRRDKPLASPPDPTSETAPAFASPSGARSVQSFSPRLVGRIEMSEPAPQDATASATVFSTQLVALPPTTASPAGDEFSSEHISNEHRAASSSEPPRTHRVRDGDTLSELARRYLGRRERFLEIFAANRDKLTSPDLLPIGKELRIPPQDGSSLPATTDAPAAESSAEAAESAGVAPAMPVSPGVIRPTSGPLQPPRIYRVQNEETLVQVAERVYGDATRYRDLYEANRDRLDSPQNLRPGTILVVP